MTELAAPPETPWPIFRDHIIEQTGDDGAYARWLSESGTLEGLAGLMACGTEFQSPQDAYQRRCELFGVPCVMYEVGRECRQCEGNGTIRSHVHGDSYVDVYCTSCWGIGLRYEPPSPQFATAVLMEQFRREEFDRQHGAETWSSHAFDELIRQHHPAAIAYRLRLCDGPWHERRL